MFHKLSLACALAAIGIGSASAATITFTTPTGSLDPAGSGLAVSASATVTTSAGGITIMLTDLQASPVSAAQLLSDFSFTLSDSFTGLVTSITPTGTLINVAPGGAVTSSNDALLAWGVTSSGTSIHIDSLSPSGPSQTIIGPGPYTNANSSITGSTHNPFIQNTATFTFSGLTGVTAATTVTSATFSFGTDAGNNVPGTPGGGPSGNPTPEPGSLFLTLAGAGLIAVGMVRRNAAAKKA
jgi:hypothetical protein